MLIKRQYGWEVPEKEPRSVRYEHPGDNARTDPGFWVVRRMGPSARNGQKRQSPRLVTDGWHRFRMQVYDYMACGLVVGGIVAHITAHSQFHTAIIETALLTPFVWPLLLTPLGLVMLLGLCVEEMSFLAAEATFWAYAALMGFSLGCIAMVYTGASIAPVFLVAGATFAVMSVYGYATRADPSKFGLLLMMGLAGVVLAALLGFFLALTAVQFALSVLGVILFVGVTAWDAPRIEQIYLDGDRGEHFKRKAVAGALVLYLDASIFPLLAHLNAGRRA